MARMSGRQLGSYGALGGELIYEWVPDPDEVADELLEIQGYLENVEGPLAISRELLRDDMILRFKTKIDPEGDAWTEWKPSYRKYREKYYPFGGILVRLPGSGELRAKATREEQFVVTEHAVFYSTAGLPNYWYPIQEGREGPKGKVKITKAMIHKAMLEEGLTENVAQIALEARHNPNTGGAKSKLTAMEPRPFIGPSFEVQIRIAETFDEWFQGAIQLGVSSRGRVFGRHSLRGPGGQFVKRP